MKKLFKAFVAFCKYNLKEKKEVILIIAAYLRVSCLIKCFTLRKYYGRYFIHDSSGPFDFSPFRKEINLIRKVIKYLPGKHSCLKESLVVFLFFKRKGLHIPLYLGVSTKNEFLAHAWYDRNNSKGFDALEVS